MIRSLCGILIAVMCFQVVSSEESWAQRAKSNRSSKKKSSKRTTAMPQKLLKTQDPLRQAMNFAKQGNYEEASERLFRLGLIPKYSKQRTRIRYLLGLMLYQMKMNQVAAFQFISVIRSNDSKYLKESLEKLSLAADALGDDTLLNYAISRVKAESFPAAHRDMLFYRIGEFQVRNQQFNDSIQSLSRVKHSSDYYDKAQYLKGLAYASAQQPVESVKAFEELIDSKEDGSVTDSARVAAVIGKARAQYQMKDWDGSIETYRQVPRDTPMWHDTLFESSWAMLRSGRFRSALSNFQSLHSPYYEDSYIPESLLLRSIVYLYICQYDEMQKTLDLFGRLYNPALKDLSSYLKRNVDPKVYFKDIVKVLIAAEKEGFDPQKTSFAIPYIAVRKVVKEGDFSRTYKYIQSLLAERREIKKMPTSWRTSGLGKYALKTVERRIDRAKAKAGRQARAHLLGVRAELIDLFEQEGFVRYEMLNGMREAAKKKAAGKEIEAVQQVDEDRSRDFYVKNGYQYWTFRGEYWLDELGNYHYVGAQSCQ